MFQDHLDIYKREQRKKLSDCLKLKSNIYVSRFEGLTLSEYIKVKSFVCNINSHAKRGKKCSCEGLIKFVNYIERNGYIKLKAAFMLSSPGMTYTSQHARQKLSQMPLAAIGIGSQAQGTYSFVIVPKQQSANYNLFQSLLEKVYNLQKMSCSPKRKSQNFYFLQKVRQSGSDCDVLLLKSPHYLVLKLEKCMVSTI